MARRAGQDGPNVTEEPRLRCYMRRTCADVDARGRLLSRARPARDGVDLVVQTPGRARGVARRGSRASVREAAVRVGTVRVPLDLPTAGRWTVRVKTRTGWYVRYATERRLYVTVG